MDPPPVQYVTTSDGRNIADTVSGSGQALIFLPTAHSHVQMNWSHQLFVPSRPLILERLSEGLRVIQFDHRGQGMSSRGLDETHTMEHFLLDLETVVDRQGFDDIVLFGAGVAAHLAVRYAVAHPERVKAMVLMSSSVSLRFSSSSAFGQLANENWEFFLQGQLALGLAPEDLRLGMELLKQITTQKDWEIAWRTWLASDLTDVLPELQTPTLVLHPRDFRIIRAEESSEFAALLPNATMTLVDGDGMYGEAPQTLRAIEGFLMRIKAVPATLLPADRLTEREIEVLRLISAGKTNQEIANELVISVNTVGRHVGNILNKVGAANRAEATSYAHLHSLL